MFWILYYIISRSLFFLFTAHRRSIKDKDLGSSSNVWLSLWPIYGDMFMFFIIIYYFIEIRRFRIPDIMDMAMEMFIPTEEEDQQD